MNKIYLEFKKLTIVGVDKKYECEFHNGLNLIWGDMDSGKSSILNLIDYSLGGNFDKLQLDYDELRKKGRTVCLEVDFNGTIVTLERVLNSSSNIIKLYRCQCEDIADFYPEICSASSSIIEPDGWISDKILDLLNIPKVKIKESKKRDNSDSDRLSFRDLMKLIYLKQKWVGSDSLMNASNHCVHNKNIEVQKFIYGVHDDQISELNNELKSEAENLSSLRSKAESIKSFLKSTDSLSLDENNDEEIQGEIELLNSEIEKFKSCKHHALIISDSVQDEIHKINDDIIKIKIEIKKDKEKLKDYSKLKSTYEYDISCLKSSLKFRVALTEKELAQKNVECPMCHKELKLSDDTINDDSIKNEIKSLNNRISGCKDSINKIHESIISNSSLSDELKNKVSCIRLDFDKKNLEVLSPTIDAIARAEAIKQSLIGRSYILKKNKKLSLKLNEFYAQIESKEINIKKIKADIKKVEESLESIDIVLGKLSKEYHYLMSQSKLTNNYGSSINNKLMPVFRNRVYDNISSGGVRTILSVNLYLSRLRHILNSNVYLPPTLLIDTPGQNIGRYARKSDNIDNTENLSDPSIYEEIYKQLVDIDLLAAGRKYQIIVVDNDLPTSLTEDNYHLVKRFDKSNSTFEKGLINDA